MYVSSYTEHTALRELLTTRAVAAPGARSGTPGSAPPKLGHGRTPGLPALLLGERCRVDGCRAGTSAQLGVHRNAALDQRQRNGSELMVVNHRADPADRAAIDCHVVARLRTSVGGSVQMQQHHPAGRLAQVVHAGDRL